MVSGIDARLIEAEAKLNANDIAGMMTILNALRTRAAEDRQLPAGDDGGDCDDARDEGCGNHPVLPREGALAVRLAASG